jgi:flagellin-like protein
MKEKEAVSPVIGVILMVAITVVLAAVIYIWVITIMQPPKTSPRISLIPSRIGDYYSIRLEIDKTKIAPNYIDLKVRREGQVIFGTNLGDIYNQWDNGLIYLDADPYGEISGGDVLRADATIYGHGDTIILVYIPTGTTVGERTLM